MTSMLVVADIVNRNTDCHGATIASTATTITAVLDPSIASTTVSIPKLGKRGLAYNNAALANLFTGDETQLSWAYNWASSSSGLSVGFEYVPMLWGTASDFTDHWDAAVSSAVALGSTHLLAFNEPDHSAQANINPDAAAAAYMQFMQPYTLRAKLGAPAITNGGPPMGLEFLRLFLVACSDCIIDFVPIHWYGLANEVESFKTHVKEAQNVAGGRPIWVTEFGASGSIEEQQIFLKTVSLWLDGTDYVERYAYFFVDGALTKDDEISALGKTFASYAVGDPIILQELEK